MLKTAIAILAILLGGGTLGAPQHTPEAGAPADCPKHAQTVAASPYSGEQDRAIKALAPEESEQLLAGHGMGLAKTAELNGYPGPKHVLELSESLGLSAEQHQTAQRLFDEMQAQAQALGRQIVDGEAALDALFAAGAIDDDQLAEHVLDIGHLKGQLRVAHLEAHLRMRAAMDESQVAAYQRLRGYR